MFVDSHCHLDCIKLDEFDDDYDTLIQRCLDSGIEHMLCVSIDMHRYPLMLEQARRYPQVSVSAGIHPMAEQTEDVDAASLQTIASDEKVVAIGETGLDYYYNKGDKQWQHDRFRTHIRCAVELNKPVIVHTRDAGADTLNILTEEGAEKCGGVIHCFTETMDFAEQALELGFMISFSGIITFQNADALRQVASQVPDSHLLIETDSPYLSPAPHRGRQNYPAYVKHVAQKLADIRDTSIEHIAEITTDNFYRVFNPCR
ncbi:MAG: TatD family hydrolase [Thiotrichales bacterium]|nr:MAG: TatD family hydrolase [Thiotrichales bacterium]